MARVFPLPVAFLPNGRDAHPGVDLRQVYRVTDQGPQEVTDRQGAKHPGSQDGVAPVKDLPPADEQDLCREDRGGGDPETPIAPALCDGVRAVGYGPANVLDPSHSPREGQAGQEGENQSGQDAEPHNEGFLELFAREGIVADCDQQAASCPDRGHSKHPQY